MKKVVKAGVFKAECLQMMDEVQKTKTPLWITKHGKYVAKLVPITPKKRSIFGKLAGTVKIKGDIISPIDEAWDANT